MNKIYGIMLMIFTSLAILTAQERQFGYDEPFKLFERDHTRSFDKAPEQFKFLDYSTEGNVDKTTGKFNFTIPFYTYKDKYVELPIGLNYSTSGVRMTEYLSTVGVDWNLVAGGSVTRHVKGMPDDLATHDGGYPNQSVNAFTGRMYKFPESEGAIPANYGPFGLTTIDSEQYNSNSFMTSVFSHPVFTGSIREYRRPLYLYHFPKGHQAPNNDHLNSIKWFFHEHKWNSNKGRNDFERDIFEVSLGNMKFSFMIQESELPVPDDGTYAPYGSQTVEDFMQTAFKAIPLNDKGYKIEFFIEDIPLFRKWINNNTSKTRNTNDTDYVVSGIGKFVITDKNGVKYIFDEYTINDTEFLHSYLDNNGFWTVHRDFSSPLGHKAAQWGLEASSTTQWKISSIVLPNQEVINFNYTPVIYNHKTEVSRTHTGEYNGYRYNLMPMWHPLAGNDHFVNKRVTTQELVSIETPVSIIEFNYYSTTRVDVETQAMTNLKEVLIKDKLSAGNPIRRSFTLEKEIITSQFAALNQHARKRMFLKSITDSRYERSYTFDYQTPHLLGPKNEAKYQDIWGYSKNPGTTAHPSFPQFYVVPDNPIGRKIMYTQPANSNHFVFSGNDRFIDNSNIKAGTLKRINFPTKGYLEVEYENNKYYDDLALTPNVDGPGLRVSELNYFDNDNSKKLIKSYNYELKSNSNQSSGVIMYKPSFAYISNDGYDNEIDLSVMEDIWYDRLDLSHIVSYNSSTGLFKKGVPLGSGVYPLETTFDKEYLLKKLIKVSNYPQGPTMDYSGREILYREVEESIQSLSDPTKSINRSRQFNHYEDNRTLVQMSGGNSSEFQYVEPDFVLGQYNLITPTILPWQDWSVSYGLMEIQGYDIYPFPDRDQFGTQGRLNGLVDKIENYNSNQTIASKTTYEYDLSPLENRTIKSIKSKFDHTYVYHNDDASQNYAINTISPGLTWKGNGNYINYMNPTQMEVILGVTFFTVNEVEPLLKPLIIKETSVIDEITQVREFEYDDDYLLIREIESRDSKDLLNNHVLTYVFDAPNENDNQFLIDNGQINMPVKRESYKSGQLLLTQEFEYQRFDNDFNTHLHKVTSQKGNSANQENIVFDNYDILGNLLQFHRPGGLNTSQIWGYNGKYPVIKIEGIAYDEVMNTLTPQQMNSIELGVENGIIAVASSLRESFPNANVTAYTYNPLIGIKSITDNRGQKTIYEYDDFDRLEYIKDNQGKVLKAFKYGYKDQQ